ncbi:hypothetical protein QJS04_geneDACA012433 [Acorus gramineus]|uniref:Geranylgeranyl transferase type II subunit beta n=1 Tax=Acorus gramineus TaxID=55184 RepID=A0AAV9BCD4_ACOGR|nr:hypothetical protein QJS04_geneDACA012433 [Acorus gramineus]
MSDRLGLTTLYLLGRLDSIDQDAIIDWVLQCQHESGGFAGNVGHDPHIMYTFSIVQVLVLFDRMDVLDVDKLCNCILLLRFSNCAMCCLALPHRLDKINVKEAVNYIVSCKNLDGGFGCTPGAESHAGQIFCCVSALAITGHLSYVSKDLLGWWLCERQVKSGGLNG